MMSKMRKSEEEDSDDRFLDVPIKALTSKLNISNSTDDSEDSPVYLSSSRVRKAHKKLAGGKFGNKPVQSPTGKTKKSVPTDAGENFLDVPVHPSTSSNSRFKIDGLENFPFPDPSKVFKVPYGQKPIIPKPGFCIKSRAMDGAKVFINVCHSEEISEPDGSLWEFMSNMNGPDAPDTISIPLALGPPHNEKDKSGSECVCFDVSFNSKFCHKIKVDESLRGVAIAYMIESIEENFNVLILRDQCVRLKKPYHGTMPDHCIVEEHPPEDPFYTFGGISEMGELMNPGAPLLTPMHTINFRDKKTPAGKEKKETQPQETQPTKKPEENSDKVENDLILHFKLNNGNANVTRSKKPSDEASPKCEGATASSATVYVNYKLFERRRNGILTYFLEARFPDKFFSKDEFKVYVSSNHLTLCDPSIDYAVNFVMPTAILPGHTMANFENNFLVVATFGVDENQIIKV